MAITTLLYHYLFYNDSGTLNPTEMTSTDSGCELCDQWSFLTAHLTTFLELGSQAGTFIHQCFIELGPRHLLKAQQWCLASQTQPLSILVMD